jgi:hypothetical protein
MHPLFFLGVGAGVAATLVSRAVLCSLSQWRPGNVPVGAPLKPLCALLSPGGDGCRGNFEKCAPTGQTVIGEFRNPASGVVGCNVIEAVPNAYRRAKVTVVGFGPRVLDNPPQLDTPSCAGSCRGCSCAS